MEFQVNVKEFAKKMTPIIHVAQHNKDLDARGKIWIKADMSGIYLYSDSSEIEVYTEISKQKPLSQIKYDCHRSGCICCNGKYFIESLQSYPPDEIVRIFLPTTSASISPATNPEEVQELPLDLPAFPYKEKNETSKRLVKINRKALLKGIWSVKYAIGEKKWRPQYEVIVIDMLEKSVRFVAGNGAFFAIKEFMGKKVAQGKRPSQIILPKYSIGSIISLLSNSSAETVEIKKSPSNDQLIIKTELSTLSIKEKVEKDYPVIDQILCYDHPFKISSMLDEWFYPVRAMRATFDDEMKNNFCIHNVIVTVDLNAGHFALEANYNSKARATIPFTMNTWVQSEEQLIQLSCNSLFLAYMVRNLGAGGEIEFRFIDPDKPILVKSPVRFCKQLGVEAQDVCFFTTSKMRQGKVKKTRNPSTSL